MIHVYFYTLKIALFSTLIAAVVGLVAAYFTTKRTFAFRPLILASSAIPLCIPPLIIALGYVSFWGVNGTAGKVIGKVIGALGKLTGFPADRSFSFSFLYSSFGIIIAQGFYNFPLVTGIVTKAWNRLPQENENAARMLGSGERRVLFSITLPRLKGAIAAACIPVFLYCFFSFMIVLLFSPAGKSTLEVEIYHSIRSTLDIKSGAFLAVLETLTALLLVFVYSLVIKKSQTNSDGVAYISFKRTRICKKERLIFTVLIVLIFLFFFCPFLSILKSSFIVVQRGQPSFSFAQYKAIFSSAGFYGALGRSAAVGFCTAFLCCTVAFTYSVCVKLSGRQENPFLQTIPLVPMAISSVVLAWIFGLVFHRGNAVLLVIMQTLLYWPIAYRQIQNGLNRISPDTNRAAILLSKNRFDSVLRFYLPACKSLLFSSFLFSFAVSLGDATLPLVLSIPKFNTLALYTYKLASTYRFNQACASGIIMIFICFMCNKSE